MSEQDSSQLVRNAERKRNRERQDALARAVHEAAQQLPDEEVALALKMARQKQDAAMREWGDQMDRVSALHEELTERMDGQLRAEHPDWSEQAIRKARVQRFRALLDSIGAHRHTESTPRVVEGSLG